MPSCTHWRHHRLNRVASALASHKTTNYVIRRRTPWSSRRHVGRLRMDDTVQSPRLPTLCRHLPHLLPGSPSDPRWSPPASGGRLSVPHNSPRPVVSVVALSRASMRPLTSERVSNVFRSILRLHSLPGASPFQRAPLCGQSTSFGQRSRGRSAQGTFIGWERPSGTDAGLRADRQSPPAYPGSGSGGIAPFGRSMPSASMRAPGSSRRTHGH